MLAYSILKIFKKTREKNLNPIRMGSRVFEIFTRVILLQELRKIEENFLSDFGRKRLAKAGRIRYTR